MAWPPTKKQKARGVFAGASFRLALWLAA